MFCDTQKAILQRVLSILLLFYNSLCVCVRIQLLITIALNWAKGVVVVIVMCTQNKLSIFCIMFMN